MEVVFGGVSPQQVELGRDWVHGARNTDVRARRTRMFLDLREVNAALGYAFHDPPTLGVRGAGQPDANTHNLDGDGDGEDDEEEHDKHVE